MQQANAAFTVASAVMSPEMLEEALLCPKQSVELDVTCLLYTSDAADEL